MLKIIFTLLISCFLIYKFISIILYSYDKFIFIVILYYIIYVSGQRATVDDDLLALREQLARLGTGEEAALKDALGVLGRDAPLVEGGPGARGGRPLRLVLLGLARVRRGRGPLRGVVDHRLARDPGGPGAREVVARPQPEHRVARLEAGRGAHDGRLLHEPRPDGRVVDEPADVGGRAGGVRRAVELERLVGVRGVLHHRRHGAPAALAVLRAGVHVAAEDVRLALRQDDDAHRGAARDRVELGPLARHLAAEEAGRERRHRAQHHRLVVRLLALFNRPSDS